jgi:hypothetical protein
LRSCFWLGGFDLVDITTVPALYPAAVMLSSLS